LPIPTLLGVRNFRAISLTHFLGYPSLKTVRELIYKRGYAKVKGQRLPITDNTIVEENLGMFIFHAFYYLFRQA
jgi:hypothetical protein